MFKRACLVTLGVVALAACAIIAVAVYFADEEKDEIRDKFGAEVADMCDPPAGGEASLANLSDSDGQIQFVMLNDRGMYHAWHDNLPPEMRAEDSATLDVVVCLEGHNSLVESCPYVDENDEVIFTLERRKLLLDIILLNPDGQRIYETTLTGGMPDECPDEARGTEGSSNDLYGSGVSYDDFFIELSAFVESHS